MSPAMIPGPTEIDILKQKVIDVQGQLDAANNTIAKLQIQLDADTATITTCRKVITAVRNEMLEAGNLTKSEIKVALGPYAVSGP